MRIRNALLVGGALLLAFAAVNSGQTGSDFDSAFSKLIYYAYLPGLIGIVALVAGTVAHLKLRR